MAVPLSLSLLLGLDRGGGDETAVRPSVTAGACVRVSERVRSQSCSAVVKLWTLRTVVLFKEKVNLLKKGI